MFIIRTAMYKVKQTCFCKINYFIAEILGHWKLNQTNIRNENAIELWITQRLGGRFK